LFIEHDIAIPKGRAVLVEIRDSVAPRHSDLAIIVFTFTLASPDHAPPRERAARLGDHRRLMLAESVVFVQHDPVLRPPVLVGERRVGEECRVVPGPARCVQDGKPGPSLGIETARSDATKTPRCRLLAIFAIHVQELGDGRDIARGRGGSCPGAISEASGEDLVHPEEPLGTESAHSGESAVVSRGLQLLKRLDAKRIMDP
jgi:hypothetical protein